MRMKMKLNFESIACTITLVWITFKEPEKSTFITLKIVLLFNVLMMSVITPPRNRGGVIFSLQFVCVSVCLCVCVSVCVSVCPEFL